MYQFENDDSQVLEQLLREQIVAYNQAHFDAQRLPLGCKFVDENQQVVAAVAAQLFGNWLQINWLWCDEKARGQGLASKLLSAIELKGKQLGALQVQLDTLDFQARPFYEHRGYEVKYQLDNYPRSGTRYFMEKSLS
ncbi:GNAT family N-acetyltransferase [Pseudoalteromonas rhizosphaerae]|uniref:GNAT family N-acetyltransferase n=1 Tax=Pseudoalteromonas rhizosphaerae TaxID=2518973 RepID=A0ABW8KT20_9GAMM